MPRGKLGGDVFFWISLECTWHLGLDCILHMYIYIYVCICLCLLDLVGISWRLGFHLCQNLEDRSGVKMGPAPPAE